VSQLAFLDLEPDPAPTVDELLWEEPPTSVQWSCSAHSAFRRCQLQYFFGYKLAAAKSLDPARREAWVLSQLQDLSRWRGRLVDYGMEHILVPALKAGRLPSVDDMIQATLAVARRQWEFSLGRHYRQPGLRKGQCKDDFCALYEHEYGVVIGDAERQRVEVEVAEAFRSLFRLTDFLEHLRQQKVYQAQRTLWVTFERARVKAIPDLLCWRGPQCTLVDWKATESETSDHTWQMLVYALAVQRNWPQTRPDDILVYEVRLLEGVIIPHTITEARLLAAEDYLYQSVLEIEALTGGKSLAEQDREDYEPAQTFRTCATCNYMRICLEGRK
jgi:hypothetical protein